MSRDVYCFDTEKGRDPHAVVIQLSDSDVQRIADVQAAESRRLSMYEFGTYVRVTDEKTGQEWLVASAPCGSACHCAAVAVKPS